ncbi:MAG TPA: hypothetical protein VIV66_19220 [Pyrinomonadaceae bacterium]
MKIGLFVYLSGEGNGYSTLFELMDSETLLLFTGRDSEIPPNRLRTQQSENAQPL